MFIKKFAKKHIYMEQAGADGGQSGGAGGAGGAGDGQGGGSDQGGQGGTITLEQLMQENAAMKKKMDELLNETKQAKQQRRDAEARAEAERQEKARKDGDFEQLYKSSEEQRLQYQKQLEELHGTIAKKEVRGTAFKLATELADGHDAELLTEFIERRLRFDNGEIKVLNNNGELTVSTLENLRDEVKADARFKSLLRKSQASGSGAAGSNGQKGSTKTLTRSEFEALGQTERMAFFSSGGKLVN